jgi:hypothetical protein
MNRRIADSRLVLVLAGAGLLAALSGATTAKATVIHQTVDQVMADSPQGGDGPTFQLNALNFRLVPQPGGEVVSGTDIVLLIGEHGNQDTSCAPTTSDFLHFGPTPVRASVRGQFECTRPDGSTFPLSVDVTWTGNVRDLIPSPIPYHPGGVGVQGGAQAGLRAPATVTGSITDGTTEFLTSDTSGIVFHLSDTQAFRP